MKKRIHIDSTPLSVDEVASSLGIPPSRRDEIKEIVEEAARRFVARQNPAKLRAKRTVAKQAA